MSTNTDMTNLRDLGRRWRDEKLTPRMDNDDYVAACARKQCGHELLLVLDQAEHAIAALPATPQADRAAVLDSHMGYVVDGVWFYHPDFPSEEWAKHKSVVPVFAAPPATPQAAPVPALHPRTADLVQRFSAALAEKLAAAEAKYGYSDQWAEPDWMQECRAKLIDHVEKGDPRDVAAYCAFLWHHGERTAMPSQQAAQVPEGYVLVPDSYVSAVDDMVSWLGAWRRASLAVGAHAAGASDAIDAMLAAAQAQGVGRG